MISGVPLLLGGAAGASDPYFANVGSLMHLNYDLVDVKGKTWTSLGGATVGSAPKFGSSALSCDGNGSWITATDHADLELGSSDFTIELWVKTRSSTLYDTLVSRVPTGFASGCWSLLMNHDSIGDGKLVVYLGDYSTGVPMLKSYATSIRDGSYHHVAWVRDGTNQAIYLDGSCVASMTGVSFTVGNFLSAGPRIGADQTYVRDIQATLDEFRFTKGVSRYTGTSVGVSYFTPPTEAFANNVGGDPNWASVVSLLHFDGNLTDETGKTWTSAGIATGAPAPSKYGGSSLYIPGARSPIYSPDHADWYIGGAGENFTIEAWVYQTADNVGADARYFVTQIGGGNRQFGVGIHTSNGIIFYHSTSGSNDLVLSFATTFSLNTWYHIALSKSGNTVRAFKDGTQVGANENLSSALYNSTAPLYLGSFGEFSEASLDWGGYIDEFRFTKGVARYTTDFSPPTEPFPDA